MYAYEREHVHRGSLSQNNNNNKTKERVLTNIFYYNSEWKINKISSPYIVERIEGSG